jgi:hypothetical protein
MSEPTKAPTDVVKRTSLAVRKIDQDRLHLLIVALEKETDIAPNEQDVIRVCLAESCKARGLDTPEAAPSPGDAS